ncbi:MAG: hypothetical protein KF851_00550 [Pirellulaceae bacterium]|nr:hypothetical protein [Pirellulaceae bacterium]
MANIRNFPPLNWQLVVKYFDQRSLENVVRVSRETGKKPLSSANSDG